jgi:hypothetical protein
VEVPVLDDEGALGAEEILYSGSTLRAELSWPVQLPGVSIKCCALDARGDIKEGDDAPMVFAVEPQDQPCACHASAGMDGVAEYTFADCLESAYREPRPLEIVDYETQLGLGDEQVDMRDISGDGILECKAELGA